MSTNRRLAEPGKRRAAAVGLGWGLLASIALGVALLAAFWGEGTLFQRSADVPMVTPLLLVVATGWVPALVWGGVVALVAGLCYRRYGRLTVRVGAALVVVPAVTVVGVGRWLHLGDTTEQRRGRLRNELTEAPAAGGLAEFLEEHPLDLENRRGDEAGKVLASELERERLSGSLSEEDLDALEAWLGPYIEHRTNPIGYPSTLFQALVSGRVRSLPPSELLSRWPGLELRTLQTLAIETENHEALLRHVDADRGEAEAIRIAARAGVEQGGLDEGAWWIVWQRFEALVLEPGRVDRMFETCGAVAADAREYCLGGAFMALDRGRKLPSGTAEQLAADLATLRTYGGELISASPGQESRVATVLERAEQAPLPAATRR